MRYNRDFQKIIAILTPKEQRELKIIALLMVLGMFFETFGIAMGIPFMGLLVDNSYIEQYPQLQSLINIPSESLIFVALGLFLFFYLIKNLYLIFLAYKQSKFIATTLSSLSNRLFKLYLYQPYSFHLQNNSAILIRNIIGETFSFGKFSLQTILILFSEIFVLSGILILLLIIEPIGTLVIFTIILLFGGGFYILSRKNILSWGEQRQGLDGERMQYLQQGLGGVKEIKLLGVENNFLTLYQEATQNSSQLNQKLNFLNELPRFFIEIIMITALVSLVVTVIIVDGSTQNVLSSIALFAMATFRLMPSFNRIMYALQNLKYGSPIVDLLYNDFSTLEEIEYKESQKKLILEDSIDIKDINYRYPNSSKDAIESISLSIKKGELIGFIGESGAGKSTMVDILLGLLTPQKGDISVDRESVYQDIKSWQKSIGYVPQTIFLTDDTLRKNIAFGINEDKIDDAQIWRVLELSQLDKFVKESEDGLDMSLGERGINLSGGQKQRIGIARALYHNPQIIILDEATSALDSDTEASFMNMITSLHGERTILIIAHRLTTVQSCDRIYKFSDGVILNFGTPKEML